MRNNNINEESRDILRDEEIMILFQSLSQILYNQDDIKKHLGLNKCDLEYGWNDERTMELARKCSETANDFTYDDSNYW